MYYMDMVFHYEREQWLGIRKYSFCWFYFVLNLAMKPRVPAYAVINL